MSNRSWQACLQAELQRLSTPDRPARVALVGVGHELCGDDAVGIRIAAMRRPLLSGMERFLVVEAGPAPENFTGTLRRFRPHLILLLDSALLDAEPGTVRWLDWQQAEGLSASTHTLPLQIFASYLAFDLGCTIRLIGIQPEQTFADAPLAPRVQAAAECIVATLAACFKFQAGPQWNSCFSRKELCNG